MLHFRFDRSRKEDADIMKNTANSLNTEHSHQSQDRNEAEHRSLRTRYILVAILLATVYILSHLTAADTGTVTRHIGSGFVLFWLAGGGITLAFLAQAAKKHR
jgi:hypothetical protein